jgi:adenine/guanine/hypoxanthine permease
VDQSLAGHPPATGAAVAVQSLRCLAGGFIITSLLWASALAAMLDGRLIRAAGCLGIAAVCSLFGIIHSPLPLSTIALPSTVYAQMPADPAIRCQSPYHWAAAYVLAALLLLAISRYPTAKRATPF